MKPRPLSFYVHVPFCIKKCRYCDFYSVPVSPEQIDAFIDSLGLEWQIVRKESGLKDARIQTLFFGGGTPSVLSSDQWRRIHSLLTGELVRCPDYEWTIECNPDSFTEEKAILWHSMGVTRLTFGIQSLEDRELRTLGRVHTARQALAVLESPVLSRFKSIGADLMYGLPGQTALSFEKTVAAMLSHSMVSHLSAYELTINPATPFGRHVSKIPFPSEDAVLDMAKALYDECRTHGFERYEISNFAKPGHRCRHNEAYWDHSPYVGLGPAAHSYIAPHRFANTRDVSKYVAGLRAGKRPLEFTETIDRDNLASEMIFLRLRTTDGLDENDFFTRAGQAFYSGPRISALDELVKNDLIEYKQPRWRLTEDGMFVTDAIAKKLV